MREIKIPCSLIRHDGGFPANAVVKWQHLHFFSLDFSFNHFPCQFFAFVCFVFVLVSIFFVFFFLSDFVFFSFSFLGDFFDFDFVLHCDFFTHSTSRTVLVVYNCIALRNV